MSVSPEVYEKLGAFYLGREYDLPSRSLREEPLLYDSKDLVTHGVVLGMTGSGKTGLCLTLLEEAAIDSIPAIVIDPKGDIPNLMLTFPDFRTEDFLPWVNEDDARRRGQTVEEYARAQADLWKNGLKDDWGQSGERVRRFRESAGIRIYTPGSHAGIPVSILSSFEAPPFEIVDDPELLGDRVDNVVASLLGFMGIEADPLQSGEHILLAQILLHAWRAGEDLNLPRLIEQVQKPPFRRVGVVPVESFMDEKRRFRLAMQLNNLLASPGFQSWTRGVSLDVKRLLHDADGKPQISIFSIAHLDDGERMFFVSLLLNQMLSWMRAQSGTTSLRALLYMDEIYGYLPPVANPPSKKPLLTMLKQGRAFGLGCLLATQNPVDLDYKALSNIGSWFLGRLQTAGDKDRVLDGLEGAAVSQGGGFDRSRMEEILAGLNSRVFLLNNVHEEAPVTFHVRWVMSYLRGPLSRSQIKRLMDPVKETLPARQPPGVTAAVNVTPEEAVRGDEELEMVYQLPKAIEELHLPLTQMAGGRRVIYRPGILAGAEVTYSSKKHDLHGTRAITYVTAFDDSSLVAFGEAARFKKPWRIFDETMVRGASRSHLPEFAQEPSYYSRQKKAVADWIHAHEALEIFVAEELDAASQPGESEADFRVRLQQVSREERDDQVEALRQRYVKKLEAQGRRLETAVRVLEREREQARSAKIGSVISLGSAILSAVLGRKRVSMSSVSRGATAARGVSKSVKEARDARSAEERVEDMKEEITELEEELQREVDALHRALDPLTLSLETIRIRPYKKNIHVRRCALVWLPHLQISDFQLEAAWLPAGEMF